MTMASLYTQCVIFNIAGGGGMGGRDPRDMDRRGHDLDYRRQGPGDYNRDPRDRRSREGPPGGKRL